MVNTLNNRIIVEFEPNDSLKYGTLINPFQFHSAIPKNTDEEAMKKWLEDFHSDVKVTNPQVAKVVVANDKHPYKKGDRLFVYYLAYDNATPVDVDGKEYKAIDTMFIFFTINSDGSYTMADSTFLGEQVYTDAVKTESGIYITSEDKKKESLRVFITHVPQYIKSDMSHFLPPDKQRRPSDIHVGDIVCTCDDNQYYLNCDGKIHIKLLYSEIVGKFEEV